MKAFPQKMIVVDGRLAFQPCEAQDATHILLNFPGPVGVLQLPVLIRGARHGTNCWSWNGSTDRPTLKPSVLTRGGDFVCHTWVTDGKVQFLSDSTHEFANQTLDLLEVER